MWDPFFVNGGWVGPQAASLSLNRDPKRPEGAQKKEGAEGALSCLVMCDYFSRAIVTAHC